MLQKIIQNHVQNYRQYLTIHTQEQKKLKVYAKLVCALDKIKHNATMFLIEDFGGQQSRQHQSRRLAHLEFWKF